jgi:hypothetical protein
MDGAESLNGSFPTYMVNTRSSGHLVEEIDETRRKVLCSA